MRRRSANVEDAIARMEAASENYLDLLDKNRQRANQRTIQKAVHFGDIAERYQDIASAAEDTFQWIFDDSSRQMKSNRSLVLPFEDWLANGDGVFHISGKPGSGKSTLMKFLCTHSRTKSALRAWAGDKELVIGRFFFWSRGSKLQKSLLGLIRGLTYCVISQCPDIIAEIFPQHWDPSGYDPWGTGPVVTLENKEILDAFHRLVAAEDIYENYRYCFFVDGLDEFDESLQTHTGLVNSLWSWIKTSQGHVKVCASSRELPAFQQRLDPRQRLRLQDLTKDDLVSVIQQTIRQEQGAAHRDERGLKALGEAILARADGVFLWVVLTLKTVCESLQSGETIADVLRILDTIPHQLEDFFRYILDSITPALRRKAAFIFAFALGVEGLPAPQWYHDPKDETRFMLSPSVFRYSFLDDLADDADFATRRGDNLVPAPGLIQNRIESCKLRISGRCRGLLEFRSHRPIDENNAEYDIVGFTHRSIPEFLENYIYTSTDWKDSLRGFDVAHAYSSTLIAALKLSPIDAQLQATYSVGTELLGVLQLVYNTGRCEDPIALRHLDVLEKALYVKQLEVSPDFAALRWRHFHSQCGSAPAFLSVFHTAIRAHKYKYVCWRIRHDPDLVSRDGGNDAEALISVVKGIQYHDLSPWSYHATSTTDDVLKTSLCILNHGADPASPSARAGEKWSALSYLLTCLSTQSGLKEREPRNWAAVEAMLQFTSALPRWLRASEDTIILSITGTPHSTDIPTSYIRTCSRELEDALPFQLRSVGGTATLEDWIGHMEPENSERILQILATKEESGVENTAH
jgi:hypothetical protein